MTRHAVGTDGATRDGVAITPGPEAARKDRRVRVLVAEDDHDVRDGLCELLSIDGYEVQAVSDGAQLLDTLSSWILAPTPLRAPVDVIVTDVRMPGFNGLNIVEGLRANGWDQPVVVISAFGDDALRARIKQLPRVAFLPKPFEPEALEQALDSLTSGT